MVVGMEGRGASSFICMLTDHGQLSGRRFKVILSLPPPPALLLPVLLAAAAAVRLQAAYSTLLRVQKQRKSYGVGALTQQCRHSGVGFEEPRAVLQWMGQLL